MPGHLSAAAEALTGNAWQRVGRVVSAAALGNGDAHELESCQRVSLTTSLARR